MLRRRRGRKRAAAVRSPMPLPLRPNQRWSLDFAHDQITDLSAFPHHSSSRRLHPRMPGAGGGHVDLRCSGRPRLDKIVAVRGRPAVTVSDNGTESDLDRDPNLIGSRADRLALHRSRQADPERVRGELQEAAAQRTAERDAVRSAAPCPRGARNLAIWALRAPSRQAPKTYSRGNATTAVVHLSTRSPHHIGGRDPGMPNDSARGSPARCPFLTYLRLTPQLCWLGISFIRRHTCWGKEQPSQTTATTNQMPEAERAHY
jgi:hypothetical protein